MEQSKQVLFLLTNRFPYFPGEEFIEEEIIELSKAFKEIHIVPYQRVTGEVRVLPKNVVVHPYQSKRFINSVPFSYISAIKQEIKLAARKGPIEVLRMLSWVVKSLEYQQRLKSLIPKEDSVILYSYWLTVPALAIAMLPPSTNIRKVSRVHGGDLYEERTKKSYLPFQRESIKCLDQTFSISQNGFTYLINKYPEIRQKISVSPLGVKGSDNRNTTTNGEYHLLSCSYLNPVKRLHLIVDALKKIEFPLVWTHIGDGSLRNALEEQIRYLPPNISVRFLGRLPKDEVNHYYKTNPVDIFINVSESEGLPVSIMEAYSYGVPAIATNVGGTNEIVNSENGFLLDKDFDIDELVAIIKNYKYESEEARNQKRFLAYQMWHDNYNAKKNYQAFIHRLVHGEW